VVAPYLLTALIHRPQRLVYLSSGMHRGGRAGLAGMDWSGARTTGSYSDSKLFVTTLAAAVARLWTDVLSNAVESTNPVRQAVPLMVVAGGGIYLLGGPALHWGRGRGTTALIDLGIRALAPVTGALIGFGLCFGCSYGAIGPGFVGLLIGMISAAVFDYASLSWDPGEPVPPERASLQWAPFAGTACGEPVVGLAGTF